MLPDIETLAYLIEAKQTSTDGFKPSDQARLSDEFNYDDDYGDRHLRRWRDREYAIHNLTR